MMTIGNKHCLITHTSLQISNRLQIVDNPKTMHYSEMVCCFQRRLTQDGLFKNPLRLIFFVWIDTENLA